MWTSLSDDVDRRSTRLKIKRTTQQLPSFQGGARVLLQTWQADGTSGKSHLIFVHGALSHANRHAAMFEWLVKKSEGQLKIHAFDLVGHGLSTGPRAHVDSFKVYSNDFLMVMKHFHERFPQDRFYFMGHSLGGLIVLKTMLEHEQQLPFMPGGVILSNPCIRPQQVVEIPKVIDMIETLSRRFPQMRLPRLMKGRDVAMDPEAANQFETDPLIPSFLTARLIREIWFAAEELRSLSYFVKAPTLFLVSEFDRVVDREATLLFTKGIDKKWVRVNNYKNVGHELLHENIRQKVWKDVVEWIGEREGEA